MHLCNAHLICLSKIAVIAWLGQLEIFLYAVMGGKEGELLHPAVTLGLSPASSMTTQLIIHHLHLHLHHRPISLLQKVSLNIT